MKKISKVLFAAMLCGMVAVSATAVASAETAEGADANIMAIAEVEEEGLETADGASNEETTAEDGEVAAEGGEAADITAVEGDGEVANTDIANTDVAADDKGSPDTGVEGIAGIAGIAVLAGGALLLTSKKQK